MHRQRYDTTPISAQLGGGVGKIGDFQAAMIVGSARRGSRLSPIRPTRWALIRAADLSSAQWSIRVRSVRTLSGARIHAAILFLDRNPGFLGRRLGGAPRHDDGVWRG